MKLNLHADEGQFVRAACDGDVTARDFDPNVDPLKSLLGPEVYTKIVLLDVQRSTFMDTSGIGWLVGAHKRFKEAGGQLIIHSIPALQMNVLKILKLGAFLWLANDLNAAKTLVAPSRGG